MVLKERFIVDKNGKRIGVLLDIEGVIALFRITCSGSENRNRHESTTTRPSK
jgi:hypothetical protein